MAKRQGRWTAAAKIIRIVGCSLLGLLFLCTVGYAIMLKAAPDTARRLLPYSSYIIKTDSMVPTIPVGSLVISQRLEPDESIEPGTIITFHANRFGDDIILTHYFREIQGIDGQLCYRTQAEEAPDYDNYQTHRDDIIGTYVFHVPYVGRMVEFLSSPYGLIMLVALILIWLLNRFMRSRMGHVDKGQIDVVDTRMSCKDGICTITGSIKNDMGYPLLAVQLQITLYNNAKKAVLTCFYDPLDGKVLPSAEKRNFRFCQEEAGLILSYRICSSEVSLAYTNVKIMPPRHMKTKGKKTKEIVTEADILSDTVQGEKQEDAEKDRVEANT